MVLVDEASQCTLTDLLPALYRGRRWAVIGHSDQLPAMRATSEAELRLYSWMILQGWTPMVHPRIGDLEVDFTMSPSRSEEAVRLAIEVDGEAYHREDSATDKSRDAFLAARGSLVLRVSAREVFETPLTVIAEIERRLKGG